MTTDFDRFIESVHGGREWMDGFDLWALDRVVGEEERSQVEAMMIDLLRTRGDARAIGALEALGTAPALAAIREALASPKAEVVASAAGALAKADPEAALEGALRALRAPDRSPRASAVQALRRLPGPAAEAALLQATDDAADNVRVLATDAIFERTGLKRFEVPRRGVSLLWLRLVSEGRDLRRAARAELTALLAGLAQGRSPEELGLVVPAPENGPALRRYVESLHSDREGPSAEDYDLDALDALDTDDRAWAELGLMGSLGRKDPRAPRALVHLGSRLALEPLLACAQELRGSAPWPWPAVEPGSFAARAFRQNGQFIVEVARALAHFGERQEAEATLKLVAGCVDPEIQDRARTALG